MRLMISNGKFMSASLNWRSNKLPFNATWVPAGLQWSIGHSLLRTKGGARRTTRLFCRGGVAKSICEEKTPIEAHLFPAETFKAELEGLGFLSSRYRRNGF
ncbi:hypothetical protein CEXT_159561 [Caerostris extrusa]|uniref:Uncharacterized protein n=1 Tax=Caerostris extrusa TaxID=172846 RepID=A0AAV4T2U2_CAEEX|nr:hypothetical protein CEXT_159561 [Caerostris extrusa]